MEDQRRRPSKGIERLFQKIFRQQIAPICRFSLRRPLNDLATLIEPFEPGHVCSWIGGWDECRIVFVVMVEKRISAKWSLGSK